MNWIEIPSQYLVIDKIQRVDLAEKSFCLAFWDDRYVAFSRKCPHAGAPMEQGWLDDGKVVCAYHRQRFDLQTGKGEVGQGNYIEIYPTKMVAGKWYIGVKPSLWRRIFN